MTAEQFWLQWRKGNNKSVATKCLSEISCEFAESYAAAQLAEKEREIAGFVRIWEAAQKYYASPSGSQAYESQAREELGNALEQTEPSDAARTIYDKLIYPLEARAEAAEQRLKEAQEAIRINSNSAEAEFPEGVWEESCGTIHVGIRILRERLRQREAELEQRWIAVGERMPPDTQPVLFGWWNTPRGSVVSHYCVEIGMYRSEDGYWEAERTAPQDEPIRFTDDSEQVTHWQPLPSPPKVQP